MIDVEKLRALLAAYVDTPTDYDRRGPLSKGVQLSSAAVNALPELLAIAEAAMAYRDASKEGESYDARCEFRAALALDAAVDAARKAGT